MSEVNKHNQLRKIRKKIKIGFIADDIKNFSEFDVSYNATFALMLAAQELGCEVLLATSNDLKIINNQVSAKFAHVLLKHKVNNYLKVAKTKEYFLNTLDVVFARKDPPVNENYIAYIQMLNLVSKALVVNNPEGILRANEKLYPLSFPKIVPPTIVTSKKSQILDFLKEHKEIVLKPLFFKGGEGVFYLNKDSRDNNPIIEASTINETKYILAQKYIPDVIRGDKRIVLLNGKILGAISRVPHHLEFRASVRRGAKIKAYKLSKKDFEICEMLKPALVKDGIYFASIDLIGDYLIEVNVTCPASLQEVERATGKPVAKEIVKWAVEKALKVGI